MKTFILSFLLVPAIIMAQTQYRFNINSINLPFDNKGILAYVNIPDPNPVISGSGGKYASQVFLFSSGFLLAGYANDTLWTNGVAPSSLIEDYLPGTVENDPSDPKNKIYVIKKSDPDFGQSWQDWIDAVSLGADYYDGNSDGIYNPTDLNGNNIWDINEDKPAIIGDEMTWCVYNDEVPSNQRRFNTITPKGIEIQQTLLGFVLPPPLGNTIFIRYRLINTGTITNRLDSVIFAVYADPDLGNPWDDLIGCDSLLNSGLIYNNGPDSEYGSAPPSFFMKYLQGPIAYIPGETFIDNNSNGFYDNGIDTPLDTAYNLRGNLFSTQSYEGAKNLNISANVFMIGGDPWFNDPANQNEVWNYLNGYSRVGSVLDPCILPYGSVNGGVNCSEVNPYFLFSGDPVSNIGWIDIVPADIRTIVSTGRFTLEANQPIDIWIAYIVGQGNSALNSVTVTKNYAQNIQTYFNTNFTNGVVSVEDENNLITDFSLSQNYPNPFNPSTTIKYTIPNVTLSGVEGSRVQLRIYDVLGKEIATLVNEEKPAGNYEVNFNASSLSSGVYFYTLRAGSFVQTKKMLLVR